ncbi:MAG: MlaD family protein [Pseudomonadota bacterium]
METRANYALIGAFVILVSIAALGFTLWLGQSQFQREFDEYDIVFEGPVTLEAGAAVRYIGIKVGEVESVRIDRSDASKVRARVSIDAETPVKTDSTAVIDFAGITGVTFVQINAGAPGAPFLEREAGEPVPVIPADRTQLSELVSGGREVVRSAEDALQRIDTVLSDENIESLSNTLRNLEIISAKLAEDDGAIDGAAETLASINRATASFENAANALGEFGEEADQRIAEFGDQFSGLVEDVSRILESSEKVIGESARAAAAAADAVEGPARSALEDASLVSQDLRRLINRLDRIARDVEQNPQSFVVGDPIPYEKER